MRAARTLRSMRAVRRRWVRRRRQTRDGLIQLDVAVGDALAVLLGHLGDDFAVTALEAVLDEPLADEFLGELLLLFTTLEALFVAFGIEVREESGVWISSMR